MTPTFPSTPSRITLVCHTHWDREWYEPFEVFRAHLVDVLDEALDELERDRRLHFTLDGHVALVDDYLELRPESEPRIRALVTERRLHVGPWFTQADTLLADGESLIRNLALGIRRADALGGAMRLGYMPDQFGHAAQVPQVLRLFGIEGAVIWRGVGPEPLPGAFQWEAPDGSAVTALWLRDGYGSGRRLPSDASGFTDAVARILERQPGTEALSEVPLLIPIGDDHVRLATWLPAAAEALRHRWPGAEVTIGGYQDHLPEAHAVLPVLRGELRSPAFAPVLAGVASARMPEKQMAARVTTLLLRYAEPLAAWCGAGEGRAAMDLARRAWRHLLHNQAHDSAAGCGVDAAHEDVRARYRWAEQLANAARDRALSRLRLPAQSGVGAVAFHPGPAAPTLMIEARVPRGLAGDLVAIGADGIERPVQSLGLVEERPLFEGEFPTAELGPYLGGLDPRTPLFGKYFTGIAASEVEPGLVRLDVGLGDEPVPPGSLAADQRRVEELMATTERFHIVIHGAAATRPVLVQAGPAREASFLPIEIRAGRAAEDTQRAGRLDGDRTGIFTGSLAVTVNDDGSLRIADAESGLAITANDLVDEGDRGDLYHFDPVAAPALRPRLRSIQVVEEGPLRARLRIEQAMDVPVALDTDRKGRASTATSMAIVTEVTLVAGERRVELRVSLENHARDHRLRALLHAPIRATRLDAEQAFAVVPRPLDPTTLGTGVERPARTGQHQGFVDISDERSGVALLARGLPEHELIRAEDGKSSTLALTLLRSVGWLSRGDLTVIDHAAGPILPTPGAQEVGAHVFEYALLLHPGNYRPADVALHAARYRAPALALPPSSRAATVEVAGAVALVEVTPPEVMTTAIVPSEEHERATVLRLLNASDSPVTARAMPAFELESATRIDPLERALADQSTITTRNREVSVSLRPWEVATLLLVRRGGAK